MTTTIRAQVSLESATLLPEDACLNVWHFNSASSPVTSDGAEIVAALDTFYNTCAEIYSANTITGEVVVKLWDLADPPPRIPIITDDFTITGLGEGDALPTECALVMSFQSLPVSGVNQRRRRGRLYLGPLNQGISTTALGVVRVTSDAMDAVVAAATGMIGAGEGDTWQWSVFSPSTAGNPPWDESLLFQATAFVDNGWVDDAFDTQRRRGTEAGSRVTFPI
jgi:hypothetical protein